MRCQTFSRHARAEGANPFADPERIQAAQEGRAYSVSLNLTGKCFGSCAYCYACSTSEVGEDPELLTDDYFYSGLMGCYWCNTLALFWDDLRRRRESRP
ncbi:MAG: hypothetical protein HYY20_11205 [Candidatus Tectomicrobia bacterium]|uniref:Radical SAM protein n=1 Tax=Tectimicrobiota bacterium TaxID=2528274 RepID=A0A932FZG0_UNCTE|nr:hypothetical protein [Candidatus Tectomicrobia bacterium]